LKNLIIIFCTILLANFSCKKEIKKPQITPPKTPETPVVLKSDIDFWLTNADQSVLLQKVNSNLVFGNIANNNINIEIDSTKTYQTIDGFGYTLTGGSAELINKMEAAARAELLQELFGNGANDISISYLRISVGASDLSSSVYSYDDFPDGKTLSNFNIAPEKKDFIPVLKEILAINPKIKIMATPWSAPVWMKDNGSSIGGSLKPENYEVYAQYLVKYIQAMKTEGIVIDAITPQNEPLNPQNNPSMYMTALQQADFIKNNLGPAFAIANIKTKIIAYDHNADVPDFPITVLNDVKANPFVDGSAFHLYGGNITALSTVHNAFPNKNLYFTEQWTGSKGEFAGDLKWHIRNIIIGSMRNWSRNALEWNLANDPNFGPHTPGGCTECKGAITINGSSISRNVAYYIVAHASKFVPAGSVRIESNNSGNLQTVAFKRPDGKKVLIAENDGAESINFNIKYNGKWFATTLAGGGVGSFVW
jgi:glucosylceramidase